MTTCSCGDASDHIIARRTTADGKHVCLWSTGELTWALGYHIKGSARPRTDEQRRLALRAGWLVLGEVCIYDASEVSDIVRAARWAAARDGLPGSMRRRMSMRAHVRPQWTVLQADRDGRPTCRVWRVDRDAAIWHERGVYEYMHLVRGSRGTYRSSGIKGKSLRDVLDAIV